MSKRFLPNFASIAGRRWVEWLAFDPPVITRKQSILRIISGERWLNESLGSAFWSGRDFATNLQMDKNATVSLYKISFQWSSCGVKWAGNWIIFNIKWPILPWYTFVTLLRLKSSQNQKPWTFWRLLGQWELFICLFACDHLMVEAEQTRNNQYIFLSPYHYNLYFIRNKIKSTLIWPLNFYVIFAKMK